MATDETAPSSPGSIVGGMLWLGAAGLLVIGIYLSVPGLARAVPWRWEQRAVEAIPLLGHEAACQSAPESRARLDQLVHRIYPIGSSDQEFTVEVTAIHGPEVNAFAFLAGKIFVFDGLIQAAESPEELAAVLAHEIEHVRLRHVTQGLLQRGLLGFASQLAFPGSDPGAISILLGAAAGLKFTREQEADADAGALMRLRDGEVSPLGFAQFFRRHPGGAGLSAMLSDHPSDQARLDAITAFPKFPTRPILTNAEWGRLQAICRSP